MTDANTVIWSGEHRAYWRPNACGYTRDVLEAGMWPYAEAERMTKHCGPEKRISLLLKHEVPEVIAAEKRRQDAAIALWHRFAPSHRMEWETETNKAEYLLAVDAVMEVMNAR